MMISSYMCEISIYYYYQLLSIYYIGSSESVNKGVISDKDLDRPAMPNCTG